VLVDAILHYEHDFVHDIYHNKEVLYLLLQLGLWSVWDLCPVVFLFHIHYKNFISFEIGEEILDCEYTIDD